MQQRRESRPPARRSIFRKYAAASLSLAALSLGLALPALATVHAGDKVNVRVYNHPELSSTVAVDGAGNVTLPLAGTVAAANSDPKDVAARIRARLAPYIHYPAVEVSVVEQSQSIFVAGGPGGVLAYTPGETLAGAIGQALQQSRPTSTTTITTSLPVASTDPLHGPVDLHAVRLLRDGASMGPYDVDALMAAGRPGPLLQPGDTIALPDKPVAVTVNGAVREPGVAHLDPTEPLSDAIQQVGGVDDVASTVQLVLIRAGQRIPITTSSLQYSSPAQSGDLIEVPRAPSVTVVGDVNKPGTEVLRGDSSLVSALYTAGGPNAGGDLKNIRVVHQGTPAVYDITGLTHGQTGTNPLLSDGDTVFVASNPKVDYGGIFRAILSAPFYLIR